MTVCGTCGREVPRGSRSCGTCGAEVQAIPAEIRKIVTVLFCDLVGYTRASEGLDPETVRRTQLRYFDSARQALERHGGTVEKFIGDAVMAVFGVPRAREDDALRAVRAALDLRAAVAGLGLDARIGVNTGEVVAGSGDALVTGDAVNTASRLEQAASPGDILLGNETYRLCRGQVAVEAMEPFVLKGKRDPVPAHRVVGLREPPPPIELTSTAPLIGRATELESLMSRFEGTVSERRCHVAVVSGPAGIGKSRLAAEFAAKVSDRASVWTGRCLSYGEGITYWPLREIFRQAGADPALEEAMARTSREETFREVRLHLEERARALPVVLVLDDIHWAEPTLLDLIEHLRRLGRGPILILCLTRPDLFETYPSWGGEGAGTTLLQLERLEVADSERLLDTRAADLGLDDEPRRWIVDRAEGNPLFLEELLAMVADLGGDPSARDRIPTTIQAVLVARLERLESNAGRIAALASIEGRAFHQAAVEELASPALRRDLDRHLTTLVRSGLIHESSGLDAEDFEFRHQLIRDAAYHRIVKAERAELHERFAVWVERDGGRPETMEIAGYHLEQAARLRIDLDPMDERAPALAARSAEQLGKAGDRAFARSDMTAATNLLRRAAALLEPEATGRALVLCRLGAAFIEMGRFAEARAVLGEAAAEAGANGDTVAGALASAERALLDQMIDPHVGGAVTRAAGQRLIAAVGDGSDDLTLAKAWYLIGFADLYAQRYEQMKIAMTESLRYAERAGDFRQRSAALQWLTVAIVGGPTTARDAIAELQRLRATVPTGSEAEGGILVNLGVLTAMTGRIGEARRLIEEGRETFRSLGMEVMRAVYAIELSVAEHMAGDPGAAESALREACEDLEAMGERDFLSTASAYLGRALADQGKDAEAIALARRSEELAAPDDIPSQVAWRSVKARILARRGDTLDAERLAREALTLAETGDAPVLIGETLVALAEVLLAGGGLGDEVDAAVERAVVLFGRKGAEAPAERARSWLAAVSASRR